MAVIYLALLLLTSLPSFQSWGADAVAQFLAEKAACRVSIGRLRVSMLGRIVLDNVMLYDQRDTLMLQASRIAAKVDFAPLVEKKVRISGAQLIGTRVRLYKDGDAPLNVQFLVDAFSSKDTTSKPLDLQLGALVVRRGEVRFDRLDTPLSPGKFSPEHLHVKDLSLTARLMLRKPDTLAIDLRNLSFSEQSGLRLQRLSFEMEAGRSSATLRDFLLRLPESSVSLPVLTAHYPKDKKLFTKEWLTLCAASTQLTCSVRPSDVECLLPKLHAFSDILRVSSDIRLSEGTLSLPNLSVSDNAGNLSLRCDATLANLFGTPAYFCDLDELRTGPALQQFLTRNLQGEARELSPILTRLGSTNSTGNIAFQNRTLHAHLLTESEQGTVSLDGTLRDMQEAEAELSVANLRIGHLLDLGGEAKGTTASVEANVACNLPKKGEQVKLATKGVLNSLIYKGYEHRNIPFSASLDGGTAEAEVRVEEPNGLAHLHLLTAEQQGVRSVKCQAQLKDFAPHSMNLTKGYEGERFSASLEADFNDIDPHHLSGGLKLNGLQLASEKGGTLRIGDVAFSSLWEENGQHLLLESDFLRAKADGNIHPQTLPASFIQPVRQALPSLFTSGERPPQPAGNDFRFLVEVQDTMLTRRLLGTALRLPERSTIDGTVSDIIGHSSMHLNIPCLQIGNQQLQHIVCRAEAGSTTLQASLQCERIVKGKPVEINIDAYAKGDKVTSRLRWDNKRTVVHSGDISLTAGIFRDQADRPAVDAKINNSRIVIGDTLWQIKPASILYRDKVIDVQDLSISQAERHINIGGRISELSSDTLKAELADIDISYIMDLVNFHKVDFDGRATGSIYGTSLLKKPFADAFLQVKEFTFNEADLGSTDIYANWGKQERTILLEADMRGPLPTHHTTLRGTIIPADGPQDGLNLNIQTSQIDLSFLNKFTGGIFRDLEGRASGWTRVFGPFKYVNLEGDMFVNEMKMHVLALGTDYHVAGDSVIMRPDNIWLRGVRAYDNWGKPGMSEHSATIDAHLMHSDLKDLRYDISINANNMHCYNFPNQGSSNFYGTAFADAQVHLSGETGTLDIDVDATPLPGTTFVYNAATPGTVTESEFVTYIVKGEETSATSDSNLSNTEQNATEPSLPFSSDVRINFNLDVNPDAKIRILMDARSGDNILLMGNGRLHANYYNKGRFQLFGTYRVSEGTYHMSIRDVIRKDFTFQPDGTVIFGGDAMQAALNLKAIYTVPNVSLDDLSATGLGLSNTRVDCIMNIGGIARSPSISFDFDIPNANEDEKQMVRSMINTEEEKDMQAVYLLGVGRFYTYGTLFDSKQTKSSMAMNSVLSSVLSSRFNQIMSQALGGSNWSFGTNLRTGEAGWEQLDVEGMLSGKMFSGRLQFNGNFGYRDNKYKMGTANFIGDFDIQYRLSPNSPFSLKAYNQTNDRYFTQSSLTTQGVGIKFQRDFNRWQELFHRKGKKGAKTKD